MKVQEERFPRNVYKKGGPEIWGRGVEYSTVLVEDEEELDEALEDGYVDDFHEALFGKETPEKKAPKKAKAEKKPAAKVKPADTEDEDDF